METDGSFKKSDIYARVTDQIIRAIEAGVKDYEMPWYQRAGSGLPRNASTAQYSSKVFDFYSGDFHSLGIRDGVSVPGGHTRRFG